MYASIAHKDISRYILKVDGIPYYPPHKERLRRFYISLIYVA